jgi:hypothetical protein
MAKIAAQAGAVQNGFEITLDGGLSPGKNK